MSPKVLVVGATGQLGSVVVRQLLERGISVRAISRHAEKLQPIAAMGAETLVADFVKVGAIAEACRGITDIVATANNNMGSGPTSPRRLDLNGYQNLCAAARNMSVRRLMYVSFRGVEPDSPVDIFRIKWHVEDAIRRSGVPHVLFRPTAFMDVWIDSLMAADIRKSGKATIFGDGTAVANYIAVEDVAAFMVAAVADPSVVNEAIDLGGPSNISFNDLATLVERRLQSSGKRRHIPVPVMRFLPPIVNVFNEKAARLMTLGYFAATRSQPFPGWQKAADRFRISPRTVETYLEAFPRA